MLNRLMFIYFIQKKGFLDNDTNYLGSGLRKSKEHSKNVYYKNFLCPLFFEGFAKKEEDRKPGTNRLLGKVPYLDGGLFQRHQIEKLHGKEIQIKDAAFENLFTFFEKYNWHLDERPLRADNEINPDVLGYIFEKYINQKQMGAYYTKEDITEYISKNTIIPFLFDQSQKKCKIAFEGEQSVWRLLKENPDRYIYDAVKKGVELDLPEEIAVGIKNVSKRTEWNKPASPEYALPTEIWREVMARRQRYEEVSNKMSNGEISSINDLITYNLDIRQFAQDVIENCEGPELLRAIYYTIAGRIPEKSNQQFQPGMSVLDPTCGSGAFLFAALNILEPLYEACLDRMQVFLDELESSGQKHRSDKFGDFRKILKRIDKHPNRRYFILKSIVLSNLYGVDIMEEATEICKLRLFLKLVAQVDNVAKIEPLPDIDFNIRAGNTLVGFANKDEVREAITTSKAGLQKQKTLMFGEKVDAMDQIEEKAEFADRAFKNFRQMQTGFGMDSKGFSDAKEELSSRLNDLANELDRYLASKYGIDRNNIPSEKKYNKEFAKWRESHQPFHWFSEFYGIINEGGFDVIIGNPPYVEYKKIQKDYVVQGYETEGCGNLYAFVMEKSFKLNSPDGRFGMIVPISIVCSERMSSVRRNALDYLCKFWVSNFAIRPQPLFAGIMQRNSIVVGKLGTNKSCRLFSTNYLRWTSIERDFLFKQSWFSEISGHLFDNYKIPKVSSDTEVRILQSISGKLKKYIGRLMDTRSESLYFHDSGESYWTKTLWEEPEAYRNNIRVKPSQWFSISIPKEYKPFIFLLLNSNLFYWLWTVRTDCRHLTKGFINSLSLPTNHMVDHQLIKRLLMAYSDNTVLFEKRAGYKSPEIKVQNFKPIIDEIDRVLAKHYGFTDEELDFIINYDIKYRMGLG